MASDEALTAEEAGEGYVVKNFALTWDQAEWLRTRAFETRRPQAEIVRDAIDQARKSAAAEGG